MSDPTAPIVDFINRFNAALGVTSPVDVEHTPDGARLNMTGEDAECGVEAIDEVDDWGSRI